MPTRANPNRAETPADGADGNAQTAPADARISEALELLSSLTRRVDALQARPENDDEHDSTAGDDQRGEPGAANQGPEQDGCTSRWIPHSRFGRRPS